MTSAKRELRLLAEERRRLAGKAHPRAHLTLAEAAPAWMILKPSQTIGGYWPFRSEMDPRPLMRRLCAAGAALALPCTPPRRSREVLTFRAWRPDDPLAPSAFGVSEPSVRAEALEPDLILVPLLAFDRRGGRLGYGAGHYDRTLRAMRARKALFALGVAFSDQEVDDLPVEAHDEPLDGVLTEQGFLETRPQAP